MQCPSCRATNPPSSHFCSACGAAVQQASARTPVAAKGKRAAAVEALAPVDAAPTPEQLAELVQAAEAQIDTFLVSAGIPDPAELTDEQGWRKLQFGSASGRAGIIESEGELFLHVEAYVMPLPSDGDLIVPLMRELLEGNIRIPGSERVGIDGESVFVVSVRRIQELQHDDFARCIHGVMALSDHLDDLLMSRYSSTTKERAPAKKNGR